MLQINKLLFIDNKSILLEVKSKIDLEGESFSVCFILIFWILILGIFPDILLKTINVSL
jgi:NADH:ubiquinone oxidoreductase subunit 4 (subunit M)